MKDFTFNVPQDIIFGKGSLKRLPELLEKSGSKKMLLISGPVLKKIGMVEKVEEIVKASGIEVEVFTDVEANPSVATVDKATEAYKKAGATKYCSFRWRKSDGCGKGSRCSCKIRRRDRRL